MRHRKQRGKLERPSSHRKALMRNQVTSLLDYEMIETTDAKAKVLRRVADRMITLGKRGTLHARRRALAVIRDRDVAAKLFDELAPRYATRPGGYTRVLKVRQRVGDAAPMSIVELVDRGVSGVPSKAAEKPEKPAKAAKAPEKRAAKPKAEKKEKPARTEKKPAAKSAKPAKGGGRGASPGSKKTGRAPRAPK
jgi:large subunit ribosomal protein L17